MSNVRYTVAAASQAGNISDLVLSVADTFCECTNHQLQIICTGTPSAGTVTVKCKAMGGDRWFTLKDKNGVVVSLDLTTGDIINIDGIVLESVKITMAGFATATAWVAKLRGW